MIMELGVQHQDLKLYKACINREPELTLTYFTIRSNLVPVRLNGKNCYNVI